MFPRSQSKAIVVDSNQGRTVAYARMSTEHQQYSIDNQVAAIHEYAAAHGLHVDQVFADRGISGLKAENRPALQQLMNTVVRGTPTISTILVYDVSRWGRFQDTDEGAFYEYLCRMHAVDVIYCAEPFGNDRTPLTALLKSMKRVMAAEYSRELSVRMSRALRFIAQKGFDQGGPPPYGLKHVLVDSGGNPVRTQRARSRLRLRKHHVKLAPGPKNEILIVRSMFRRFVELKETTHQIAQYLNGRGDRTRSGSTWNSGHVARALQNQKYLGTHTFNLTTGKLKERRRQADPSDWILVPNAFRGIIAKKLFDKAQRQLKKRRRVRTNDELLDALRAFLAKHGKITDKLMRRYKDAPRSQAYAKRFGSLMVAYQLIGYAGVRGAQHWTHFRLDIKKYVIDEMKARLEAEGASIKVKSIFTRFWVSGGLCGQLKLVPYRNRSGWRVKIRKYERVMVYVLARLTENQQSVLDYYVIPADFFRVTQKMLVLGVGQEVDRFRVADIATVCWAIRRRQSAPVPRPISTRPLLRH